MMPNGSSATFDSDINTSTKFSCTLFFFGDMFFTKMISWQEAAEDSRKVQYNQITTTGFSVYKDLTNCLKMVELAADIDKDAYEGLALFIKAFRLYDTTMALGDIPYSEAMKGEEGNTRPKYDTQKEVILQMLDDLDAAYTHFSNATRNFDGDIVYGGDPAKWKRAVSALQLRILLNLSKKEQDTELNVRQRFSSVVAKQELFESNDDNFQCAGCRVLVCLRHAFLPTLPSLPVTVQLLCGSIRHNRRCIEKIPGQPPVFLLRTDKSPNSRRRAG